MVGVVRATILGCGSWGTALAVLLARNGHDVDLVGRNEEEIDTLHSCRENFRYLPGFILPSEVQYHLLGTEEQERDLTILAVPSGAVRVMVAHYLSSKAPILICSKGLEVGTSMLMSQVIHEVRPDVEVGVLSGPNLAIEIVRGIPTVAISAFEKLDTAQQVQRAFSCGSFRVSVSDDIVGIELAGALKNVLAIGAGMSDGLGFGDNTKGAFLSRGLMEISKLGTAMGARLDTFLGPAGVGDLFATANSRLSRNYRVGVALGKGTVLSEALAELGQVAEGVTTSEATQQLALTHRVDMPVFTAVEAVIRGRLLPRMAVSMLMDRNSKEIDVVS